MQSAFSEQFMSRITGDQPPHRKDDGIHCLRLQEGSSGRRFNQGAGEAPLSERQDNEIRHPW
jgi:hypothetical protein